MRGDESRIRWWLLMMLAQLFEPFRVGRAMRTEMTDGVIRLRTYRAEDAEPLYEAVRESLDELCRWLPWAHEAYSRDEARAWIESRPEAWGREEFSFVIERVADGSLLGGVGLNQLALGERRANLGYWVRRRAGGQGIATRAARLLAEAAFEDLKLQRLEIIVAEGNLASQRVAAKLGAVREGTLRNRIRVRDEQRNAFCYSLVPSDLRQAVERAANARANRA